MKGAARARRPLVLALYKYQHRGYRRPGRQVPGDKIEATAYEGRGRGGRAVTQTPRRSWWLGALALSKATTNNKQITQTSSS